jgi:hypothetical protein
MTTMRDDQDLERLLRDTLAARAETVTSGPAWAPIVDAPHRPHRWLAPLIAAAVVVAVAVGVIVVERSSHHTNAVHPSPSPSPSITGPVQQSCLTTLPAAWRTAIAGGTTTARATSVRPLDVAADGTVLVARDFGTSRDVALLSPTGQARRIYTVPSPDRDDVEHGVLAGRWALVPVMHAPRGANGVDPTVVRVMLIDTKSGSTRTLATASDGERASGDVIAGATMFNGRVYYDHRPTYPSKHRVIHEYDIATRVDRVVASGAVGSPQVYGRGVGWGDTGVDTTVSRALPAPVEHDTEKPRAANELTTDGTAFAWIDASNRIAWFGAGSTAPTRTDLHASGQVDVIAVAGPIVLFVEDGNVVHALDARTGASTLLPTLQSGLDDQGLSRGGFVVGETVTGEVPSGGGAPPVPSTALIRLDVTKLPELKC